MQSVGYGGQQPGHETGTHPWGNAINHFCLESMGWTWSAPVLFPWEREIGVQQNATKTGIRLEYVIGTHIHMICASIQRSWGNFGLQLRGCLASLCNLLYLVGSDGEKEEELLSQESGTHIKRNHSNWKQQQDEFRLDIMRKKTSVREVKHWNKLYREIQQIPSLGMFKTWTFKTAFNSLSMWLTFQIRRNCHL